MSIMKGGNDKNAVFKGNCAKTSDTSTINGRIFCFNPSYLAHTSTCNTLKH